MTVTTVAGLLFGIAFLVGAAILGPRHWRGETELDGSQPPPAFPLSDALWRGVVRSFSVWLPFIAVFFMGGALGYDAPEGSTRQTVGMLIGLFGLVGGLAVHLPILLFNRPRRLVPPHLRDEPGALAERRARRRRAAT